MADGKISQDLNKLEETIKGLIRETTTKNEELQKQFAVTNQKPEKALSEIRMWISGLNLQNTELRRGQTNRGSTIPSSSSTLVVG